MLYKILADIIVLIRFLWILFMLAGFLLTVYGFFHKEFFDRWLFRTLHLFGIVYVGILAALGQYCPLTVVEYNLRSRYNPQLEYPGSFIAYHVEKLVYPEVNPLIIIIPTVVMAVFALVVFVVRPPRKIIRLLE